MDIVRSVYDSLPKGFYIVTAQTFQISIGNNRSRIIPYHTATMAGARPFRQESAFFIRIHQTFLHLHIHRRIHQVQEREQATESIPETGIGKHITRQYFPVVRTIMHNIPIGIHFVEAAWEEDGTVQAGIESAQFVYIIVIHPDTSQYFVPGLTTGIRYFIERPSSQLFQVQLSLFGTDKRRSDTGMNNFSATG